MKVHEYLAHAIGDRTPAEIGRLTGDTPTASQVRRWLNPHHLWRAAADFESVANLGELDGFDAKSLWIAVGESGGLYKDDDAALLGLLPAGTDLDLLGPEHLRLIVTLVRWCIEDAKRMIRMADMEDASTVPVLEAEIERLRGLLPPEEPPAEILARELNIPRAVATPLVAAGITSATDLLDWRISELATVPGLGKARLSRLLASPVVVEMRLTD